MTPRRFPPHPDRRLCGVVRWQRGSLPGHSPRGRRPAACRGGFTLIELLVVLAILGMLAGLLLTAVIPAMGSGRVTGVVAEISSLEKAIQDFKLRYGIEPPSFFVFYEDGPNWGTSNAAKRSRALMNRLWPDYDFAQRDINGNGNNMDVITLQGTECLVFFLGGPGLLNGTNRQPLGFSVNPTNPFAAGGQRAGPFYEFDLARLCDVDGDGNPEYLDPLPGQTLPYLYFSSYEGAGYRPFGLNGMAGDADDEILSTSSGALLIQSIYMTQDDNWNAPMAPRPTAQAANYLKPKSFQIISPGPDFQFGAGGQFVAGRGLAVKNGVNDPYRDISARRTEFDNITNFSGGMLGELTYTP
jgi:prepilin-type N-terminal cleavage/methylation domain-containing protein